MAAPTHAAPVEEARQCFSAVPTILGTPEDDVLRGTSGDDIIAGFGGADTILGRGGDDILCGGTGGDEIYGGPGNDGIVTDAGPDRAFGGPGFDYITEVTESTGGSFLLRPVMHDESRDVLDGGAGIDSLSPEGGDDIVVGGPGRDSVDMLWVWDPALIDLAARFAMSESGGTETLRSIEGARGGFRNDTVLGDDSTNWLFGGLGADHVDGRGGSDVLFAAMEGARLVGGDDQAPDTVMVALSEPSLIDLTKGSVGSMEVTHAHVDDVLVGIENAVATDHDDIVIGGPLDNVVTGRAGNDWVHGGTGDDVLRGDGPIELPGYRPIRSAGGGDRLDGGPGTDHLDGGSHDDECVNGETVTSCESEQRASRTSVPAADNVSVPWPGPGMPPWWWLRVGELALHAHERV